MTSSRPEWTISDADESWMWCGIDPRTGKEQDGNFREYLMHEFGHWVVAQEQEPSIDIVGLGLYGLTHGESGRIRVVGGGGGVRLNYGIASDREAVIVNTAGVVAERLDEDETSVFDNPLRLFHEDSTFDNDYAEARKYLGNLGIRETDSARFAQALYDAMNVSASIIKPLLPRLRAQVLALERIVSERRLSKIEILWSGKHAALLTGKPHHHYEIEYGN